MCCTCRYASKANIHVQDTDGNNNRWTCTYQVRAGSVDGVISFSVDFTDAPGLNGDTVTLTDDGGEQSDQHSNVVVDVLPPTLTSVRVDSTNAALDTIATLRDNIHLTFTSDEEMLEPTCTFRSGGLPAASSATKTVKMIRDVSKVEVLSWDCSYNVTVDSTNNPAITQAPGPVECKYC